MKKIILLSIVVIVSITKIQAQVSENFSKQITALIKTDIDKIQGEVSEKGNSFTTYNTLLKLDECKVSYTTSTLGDVLRADYIKPGTTEIMDNIHFSLLETPYTCKDSKDYPLMLKGLANSDFKRKIELFETDLKTGTVKKVLVVEMYKDGGIIINFLNK
ncbi:MAG: hypothetical protein WDM90_22450 [Ferruginibacter sp.]